MGWCQHHSTGAEVDSGTLRWKGRVACDSRQSLAQGDSLVVGRSGRHLRELHPSDMAEHRITQRGRRWGWSWLWRFRFRVRRERAVLQRGLDARECLQPRGVRRALPCVGRWEADGAWRSLRLLRYRRADRRGFARERLRGLAAATAKG